MRDSPSIALPLVALILAFVFWPLGVILAIVAFAKLIRTEASSARTIAVVALVASLTAAPVAYLFVWPELLSSLLAPPPQCRSFQSEAKGNLKALYVAEESYRAEFDTYSLSFELIGFVPRASKMRYRYAILEANGHGFRAEARGEKERVAGDVWIIDHTNNLQNVVNACDR